MSDAIALGYTVEFFLDHERIRSMSAQADLMARLLTSAHARTRGPNVIQSAQKG